MRTIGNPVCFSEFSRFPYTVTYTDPEPVVELGAGVGVGHGASDVHLVVQHAVVRDVPAVHTARCRCRGGGLTSATGRKSGKWGRMWELNPTQI